MKYVVDVPDNQLEAFLKVMEGLRKAAIVHSMQAQKATEASEPGKAQGERPGSGEKTAYDFVEQYRDLVD